MEKELWVRRTPRSDKMPQNEFGVIDTSDEGRKMSYTQCVDNLKKPWRGMKYFSEHEVWALNEKNAIKKSKNKNK